MSSEPVRIDPGTTIGPYVVERRFAQGGMSVLYLAHDDGGEQLVLKVVTPEIGTVATRSRLMREARALAAVDHPGVVRVRGTGEHEGISWIAMDYVRGTDLKRVLAERGALRVETCLAYGVQIAEALVAAHEAGVVHRDLKPSNLLLTLDGRVVIVDFGVAKRRADPREGDVLTSTREVFGTPAYLSPEQLEHGLADERSDVWALGCVLYEMAVGSPPFGTGGSTTTAAILRDEPVFPSTLSGAIVHIINGCLRKSSFARIASPASLLVLLKDALEDPNSELATMSERSSPGGLRTSTRSSHRPPAANSSPPPPVSRAGSTRPGSISSGKHSAVGSRVGPTRGRMKGTAIRAGIAWFAEGYATAGLERVYELASPELQAILRAGDPTFGLIASGWYDTQLMGELLGLVERVASPADPLVFGSRLAEAIARDHVGGVYRSLFRLVDTAPLLEANAQRVWRTYFDEGTLTVSARETGLFEARVRGWAHHHPSVCALMRAMLESLLRAVGYKGLVVARTECVARGASRCAFEGRWNAQ